MSSREVGRPQTGASVSPAEAGCGRISSPKVRPLEPETTDRLSPPQNVFHKAGNRNSKQKRAISKEAPGPVWGPISQSVDEGCEGIPEDEPARSLYFFRGALSAKLGRGLRRGG